MRGVVLGNHACAPSRVTRSFRRQRNRARSIGRAEKSRRGHAANEVDSAILRTFRDLRSRRDRCARNESRIAAGANGCRAGGSCEVGGYATRGGCDTTPFDVRRAEDRTLRFALCASARPGAISQQGREWRDIRKRIHIMRNTTARTHFRHPGSGKCRPASQPAVARTGILPLLPCPASRPGA